MKSGSWLTVPPAGLLSHPGYRYGGVAVILCFLASSVLSWLNAPPGYWYDSSARVVIALLLLFTHLAFSLRWPPLVTAALRLLALSWVLFGVLYVVAVAFVLDVG